MKFLRKIKMEIMIFFLIIIAIIGFFIYAKVVQVLSYQNDDEQLNVSTQIVEELAGIRSELALENCLNLAGVDVAKKAECIGE